MLTRMNCDRSLEFFGEPAQAIRKHGRTQLAEGIPQLAIFSFAKSLWNGVMPEDDD